MCYCHEYNVQNIDESLFINVEDASSENLPYKVKQIEGYMKIAYIRAENSKAIRRKVGALIVSGDRLISDGYNGTHKGLDNECEEVVIGENNKPILDSNGNPKLITKKTVLHAEANAILKLAASTETSVGTFLFVTTAPCVECAKLIGQAGVAAVFFDKFYRGDEGLKHLKDINVPVYKTDLVDYLNSN